MTDFNASVSNWKIVNVQRKSIRLPFKVFKFNALKTVMMMRSLANSPLVMNHNYAS